MNNAMVRQHRANKFLDNFRKPNVSSYYWKNTNLDVGNLNRYYVAEREKNAVDNFIAETYDRRQEILEFNEVFPTRTMFINLKNIWHTLPIELQKLISDDDIYLLENGTFSINLISGNKNLVVNIGKNWFNFYIKVDSEVVDSHEKVDYFNSMVLLKASVERHVQEDSIYKYFELRSLNTQSYCY